MKAFRLATINVNSFRSVLTRKNNIQDLLAVQGVQNGHHWSNFCQNLLFRYSIFVATYKKFHDNGIALRYPITF
ncbi:hypothetical protein I4U23_021900 [Adineta vaga]|nr:hypothetical protein I4U23_021900 [Adineta vaga]